MKDRQPKLLVCFSVKEFLRSSTIPGEWKITYITLILKAYAFKACKLSF